MALGQVVAGINATAMTYVFTDERVKNEIVPAVCRAADELSRGLGRRIPLAPVPAGAESAST